MGRKRVIDTDELLFDEELYEAIGQEGLWLYVRLWALAEDWGGYEPKYGSIALKTGVLRMTADQVCSTIGNLISLGKIIPYHVPGLHNTELHWIRNLLKHQPLRNPALPKLPLPEWIMCEEKQYGSGKKYASYRIDSTKIPETHGSLLVDSQNVLGHLETETETETRKEKETKKILSKGNSSLPVDYQGEQPLSATPIMPIVISPKELSGIWNQFAPPYLPRVQSISDKRGKKLKRNINGQQDTEWWKRLFQDIDLSEFYSGKDGKWTGMDFDWAVINCEKLRGKLDRASHKFAQPGLAAWASEQGVGNES